MIWRLISIHSVRLDVLESNSPVGVGIWDVKRAVDGKVWCTYSNYRRRSISADVTQNCDQVIEQVIFDQPGGRYTKATRNSLGKAT